MFLKASNLDRLTELRIQQIERSDVSVSALSAYLSRANMSLQTLCMSFADGEADIDAVVKEIRNSKSIKCLNISFDSVKENDPSLLLDLISKSRSINHLVLELDSVTVGDVHRVFDHLERSDSIVKFDFNCHFVDTTESSIDYDRIASSISKSRTLNNVSLSLLRSETSMDSEMADEFFETCGNLDQIFVEKYYRFRYREDDEKDLHHLIEFARSFAGSKMTKNTVLPRELFSIVLYEGFKHLNWHDDQLSTVIRALLDLRTLDLIQGGPLPMSRPYLYVRCRDALERIRELD